MIGAALETDFIPVEVSPLISQCTPAVARKGTANRPCAWELLVFWSPISRSGGRCSPSLRAVMSPSLWDLFPFSAKRKTVWCHRLSFLMCLPAPGASSHPSNDTDSSSNRAVSRPRFPSEAGMSIYTHLQQVCAFKAPKFPRYGVFE